MSRWDLLRHLLTPVLAVLCFGCSSRSPSSSAPQSVDSRTMSVDRVRLEKHVRALSETYVPRDCTHPENLDRAAHYILEVFQKNGGRIAEQVYTVNDHIYRNVMATFGPEEGERIVVGAHYDAHRTSPGADDNASGVAGLLELSALLSRNPPARRLDLVAYTLEEPPFFRTPNMGSVRHARSLKEDHVPIRAMLSLEMIGYFADGNDSQELPASLNGLLPSQGNFIAVVGDMNMVELTKRIETIMKGTNSLPVFAVNAPRSVEGIDWSDHYPFWDQGYPAVMITDTSLYRNRKYHSSADRAGTLDYRRMSMVIEGVHAAIRGL